MNISLWSQRQPNYGHRDRRLRRSGMVLKATRMVGDRAQGEETTTESFSGMEMSRTFKKQGGLPFKSKLFSVLFSDVTLHTQPSGGSTLENNIQ